MFLSKQFAFALISIAISVSSPTVNGQQNLQSPAESTSPSFRPTHPVVDSQGSKLFRHLADSKPLEAHVDFKPAAEMSTADQDLIANSESSIREKARLHNLDFDNGSWSYEQILCPAFPYHLMVRYLREDGTRQTSMFSVAIPRGGQGTVRLIPNVRKGYSLFSPAPVNALTIAAFNRVRTDEAYTESPDWVGTGLCYSALAGADPVAGNPSVDDSLRNQVQPPTLKLLNGGGASITFVDITPERHAMEWAMTFDSKGKLIKATHQIAAQTHERKGPVVVNPPGY